MSQCEMFAGCTAPIAMISERGWVYCKSHGRLAAMGARARLMRPWEIKLIEEGHILPSYALTRKPTKGESA